MVGWYGNIEAILTSMTDISLGVGRCKPLAIVVDEQARLNHILRDFLVSIGFFLEFM